MKLFSTLSETARIMIVAIGLLFALFLCLGLLAIALIYPFEAPGPYCAGLFAGSLLSAAKVVLLERAISRSLDTDGNKALAQGYATLQWLLRYALVIGVLVLAFRFPHILGRVGTVLGILFLQLSAYTVNPVLKRREPPPADEA